MSFSASIACTSSWLCPSLSRPCHPRRMLPQQPSLLTSSSTSTSVLPAQFWLQPTTTPNFSMHLYLCSIYDGIALVQSLTPQAQPAKQWLPQFDRQTGPPTLRSITFSSPVRFVLLWEARHSDPLVPALPPCASRSALSLAPPSEASTRGWLCYAETPNAALTAYQPRIVARRGLSPAMIYIHPCYRSHCKARPVGYFFHWLILPFVEHAYRLISQPHPISIYNHTIYLINVLSLN